jgi:hypothetical protein
VVGVNWDGMGLRGGTGPTIDTGTLEYLACLAAGSETIAFYLVEINKSLTQLKRETKWQIELKRGGSKNRKKKKKKSKAAAWNAPFSSDNSYNSSTLAAQW